ncbi:hypothetical protein F2A38_18155 [Pseudomonas chlororaphis]|uniref:CdiI immunity protein domain-containing protein n=1 Tax=Pseudomonas chlororaphis TaxID=587753 RepID=A0AB34C2P7_9PSED|nr:hypothetical protein [Pseudomonas chlororaphis]KAA5840339.1 hypothetical protein F2A38_18155 [Pseudomonas chlororaphis]
MRLVFSWNYLFSMYSPECRVEGAGSFAEQLICNVLTDDGGVSRETTLEWIREGIARTERVRAGMLESSDWYRECWGADIRADGVRVCSLLDESYCAVVALESFLQLLVEWMAFLERYAFEEVRPVIAD